MTNECIFCKIAKGEIPCYKIYEDQDFFAFLDIKPLNPGHTLLIPKKHIQWVNDYEPFCNYWKTARKLSKIIEKSLNPIIVSYVVYGLGVSHAHIHLIPKFKNDNHPTGPNPEKTMIIPEKERKEIAERIKNAV